MRTIWKFPLEITDDAIIEIPGLIRLLSVADQDGTLTLWAAVRPHLPKEMVHISIRGTGQPFDGLEGAFIGSVLMGPFVWHVYGRVI